MKPEIGMKIHVKNNVDGVIAYTTPEMEYAVVSVKNGYVSLLALTSSHGPFDGGRVSIIHVEAFERLHIE